MKKNHQLKTKRTAITAKKQCIMGTYRHTTGSGQSGGAKRQRDVLSTDAIRRCVVGLDF